MTKSIRLIRTTVIEYTPYSEDYPEGITIEEMAKLDAESENRELVFADMYVKEDSVRYEIIEN